MKGSNRLKLWLAVAAVFALGCTTGALLDSAYRLRVDAARGQGREEGRVGRRSPEQVLDKMRRDLDLDERQAAEVRKVVDESRNEYRSLRDEARPRFDARVAEKDARRAADEKQ